MMADNNVLTVLTDVWAESVAQELMHRWPDHRLEVHYLRQEGANWQPSVGQSAVQATLLAPDVSRVWLPDGTRFYYALRAYLWELTLLFHRTMLKESFWARLIGRIYSSRSAEVLYLRNFRDRVEPWVFLCLLACHLKATEPDSGASPVVCLSSNPFGDWVTNYLQAIYAPIIVCSELPYSKMLYVQARIILRELLRRVRQLQKRRQLSAGRYSANSPVAVGSNHRRAIAVEACMGLDPEGKRSDLFWLPQSGIPDDQILVYFDRPDRPASDEVLAAVRGHGWQPLVLSRGEGTSAAANVTTRVGRLNWRRMLLLLLTSPLWLLESGGRRSVVYWCWQQLPGRLLVTDTWQAVFANYGVRLHSNYTDVLGINHVDQSVALERIGGINLRTDVAFYYSVHKDGARISPFDVFFVWGPDMEGILRKQDVMEITTLITCGYPLDHLFESARPGAARLRRDLQAAGAHTIICFFDTSFSKTGHTSRQDVEDVYQALLTEVIESPQLGLILKPKNLRDETALVTPELQSLLNKALATDRCVMLEQKIWPPISPCEAALASDLAVGYPINSAVIEAVLAGVPGVHIDLTRLHSHWFYDVGYERLVFDDLDRAMDAIRRWGRNPADEPGLGDHSAVINCIDPFRDGKAAQRIGQYMAWLLEGFDQGLHRDDVVRRASRLYAEKYGAQYVRLAPRLGAL